MLGLKKMPSKVMKNLQTQIKFHFKVLKLREDYNSGYRLVNLLTQQTQAENSYKNETEGPKQNHLTCQNHSP